MNMLLWGLTLGTIGKVLLGITVIFVHARITKEHRIDKAVLQEMNKEKALGILGIFLMIMGYALEMAFYMGGGF